MSSETDTENSIGWLKDEAIAYAKEHDDEVYKRLTETDESLSSKIVFGGLDEDEAGDWETEDYAVIRRRDVREAIQKLKDVSSDDIGDYAEGWYKCRRCIDTGKDERTCEDPIGHEIEIFHKFIDNIFGDALVHSPSTRVIDSGMEDTPSEKPVTLVNLQSGGNHGSDKIGCTNTQCLDCKATGHINHQKCWYCSSENLVYIELRGEPVITHNQDCTNLKKKVKSIDDEIKRWEEESSGNQNHTHKEMKK